MDVHVLSVGTSVIRNYCKTKPDACPKQLVARDWSPEIDAELRRMLKEKLCDFIEDVVQYVETDPKAASAELNSFLSAVEDLYSEDEELKVVLLCSDTFAGEISCSVLKKYLDSKGYSTDALTVKDLGKPQAVMFYNGIANLACTMRYVLGQYKDYKLYVSPTGGFKPESAFTYLIAMLSPKLKAVYYIRELSEELVLLPILPLSAMFEVKFDVPEVYRRKYGVNVEEVKKKLEMAIKEGRIDTSCWRPLSRELMACITSHKQQR